MSQRLGIAATLLGDPGVLLFDEPVNGLDPEGIRWVRHFLRGLAAEGRTVFVSSHLISEMALTADRLVVIGRGRLIAETSVADFVARSGPGAVKLVTPDLAAFSSALTAAGARVGDGDGGSLTVEGLTAPQIGDLAATRGPAGPRAGADRGILGGRVHGADPGRGGIPPLDDGRRDRGRPARE